MDKHEDCYAEDGSPIRCPHCRGESFREKVIDQLDLCGGYGPVTESETICNQCGAVVAYWAFGSYQPRGELA